MRTQRLAPSPVPTARPPRGETLALRWVKGPSQLQVGGAGAGPEVGCKVGQGTVLVQAGGLLEVRMTDG